MAARNDGGGGGVLTISLDFELFWGMADLWDLDRDYKQLLERTRLRVVPRLLEQFASYDVHATWATVGFLLCRTADEIQAIRPSIEPGYNDPNLSPYRFLAGLGADESEDPWRLAPTIVEQILAVPGQEVGSHSFSHFYCLEPGATESSFAADLNAWRAAADRHGLNPSAICFGRNQYDDASIDVCERTGFQAYRGAERAWCYRPTTRAGDSIAAKIARRADAYLPVFGHHAAATEEIGATFPCNVPSSRFLRAADPKLRWLEPLKQRRIRSGLDHASRTDRVFHLWWHPQDFARDPETNLEALGEVLAHFDQLRQEWGMVSANMTEVAQMARPSTATRLGSTEATAGGAE